MTDGRVARATGKDQLAVRKWRTGEPVALLHGFTQNSQTWGGFAGALDKPKRQLTAVDLPGHGDSSSIRADLWESANLVADACGTGDYIGYSLGGRVLLHVLLSRPDVVRRAVLVGATAGIEDAATRQARIESDEVLARQLEGVASGSEDFREFLDGWLAGPLFRGLSEAAAGIEARLRNDPAGLASSLRLCGTGTQEPLWDRLREIEVPVLVIAGEYDEKFTIVGKKIAHCIGENAIFTAVAGAGHPCHLEKSSETAQIVNGFLS